MSNATLPFKIKICGVTESVNAMMVAASGADAIGLNFYEPGKRFVSHFDASMICHELPKSVTRIGVFVNEPIEDVRSTVEHVGLDYVQLHGDESIDYIKQLGGLKIIRALRIRPESPDQTRQQFTEQVTLRIRELLDQTNNIHAILLDAYDSQEFGGTGHRIDWEMAASLDCFQEIPLILAGGLNPRTVRDAIVQVKPAAVDVASGVESAPGMKDPQQVQDFISAASSAFTELVS